MRWVGFIISLVSLAVLIALCWKFIGYRKTYFLVAFLTVLLFFICFFLGSEYIDKLNETLQDVVIYSALELPIVLFALSVRNLYVKNTIPRMFTIANIVLSLGIILVFIFAIMSGVSASMIG